MIDLNEIEKAILDLEKRDTTFASIERLAWLYTVKDHLKAVGPDVRTGELGNDEFCKACSGVPLEPLMAVLAEHMSCVKVLYPKEYDALLSKIHDL